MQLHLPPRPPRRCSTESRLLPCEPGGHWSRERQKSRHRWKWILWPAIRLRFHQLARHWDLLQGWRGVWAPMWLAAFRPQGKFVFDLFDFLSFLPTHLLHAAASLLIVVLCTKSEIVELLNHWNFSYRRYLTLHLHMVDDPHHLNQQFLSRLRLQIDERAESKKHVTCHM